MQNQNNKLKITTKQLSKVKKYKKHKQKIFTQTLKDMHIHIVQLGIPMLISNPANDFMSSVQY